MLDLLAPLRRHAVAVSTALLLAGCGGGLYIGGGDYWDDDYVRPSVSVAAPATAQAGSTVRLTAAAADEWSGIEQVAFYRIDGGTATLISRDTGAPYEADFVLPNDGRTFIDVFAWARDRAGNERDSQTVRIAITP